MDIFDLRDRIILKDYAEYTGSFIEIADERIRKEVTEKFQSGLLWPEPLLQLNPSFASGGSIDQLVQEGTLHESCGKIFRLGKTRNGSEGQAMQLYKHQADAIHAAQSEDNYVLTTGTGSGKSLSYIVPIVDYVLKNPERKGITAIIVYPMNALANSQQLELEKFLQENEFPVSFHRYTGQEHEHTRRAIVENPPNILLTNYVMLELILTRPYEKKLVEAAKGLKFLVFDELHTYRGRQGADVAMLIRRLREKLHDNGSDFQCIGTSATLAGPGTFEEKQREVAAIATKLFGSEIEPKNVIVETLQEETGHVDLEDPGFVEQLQNFLNSDAALPSDYDSFIQNPLVIWLEHVIGVEMRDGRLERCKPASIRGKDGLASRLARLCNLQEGRCEQKIKKVLQQGTIVKKPNGKPVFAFKLHQFISKGNTIYATLESEDKRYITLFAQNRAPERDSKALLYPLNFCRECGKEYYSVSLVRDEEKNTSQFNPLNPVDAEEDGTKGYLFIDSANPWPEDNASQLERLPADWLETKKTKTAIKRNKLKYKPETWHVRPDGTASKEPTADSTEAWFMEAPFAFCPNCNVSYSSGSDDFRKLGTLGSEGRSTATTILSMSTVNHLHEETDLAAEACKFLCFSDNRQDASLQSGHFNDFMETGLIRSALYNALELAAEEHRAGKLEKAGLTYSNLSQKVLEALGLGYKNGIFPKSSYSVAPEAKYSREILINDTFRKILEYRIYSDLRRGWRIVAPNLEQCGLLEIEYVDLANHCANNAEWQANKFLLNASPEVREKIATTLLDHLRSRLAIKIDVLDPEEQINIARMSRQELIEPWLVDENEKMLYSALAWPRESRANENTNADLYITPRSNFGKWLKRRKFFKDATTDDYREIIKTLLEVLKTAGILAEVQRKKSVDKCYQLSASHMFWKAGDGKRAKHDPFRVRHATGYGRTNSFFVQMYKNMVHRGYRLTSGEHTAQVASDIREEREEKFRKATLPVLYCSPTMELGVDISQLNAVGMRNVPPTPANYAQRSGRAGRSGQPALIITYCALGNSHDQHFFRAPSRMVAGSVSTPRLDLANEDLIRAHIHSIWLAETGLDLGKSLSSLLDVSGLQPTLTLYDSVKAALNNEEYMDSAKLHARNILKALESELSACSWYNDKWLAQTMEAIPENFENACERWRNLYRDAMRQREQQHAIISDVTKDKKIRKQAEWLRKYAEDQIEQLLAQGSSLQSDFYSYRYFASEGFLPGYNFPRLPLSASMPVGKKGKSSAEYISRPRFLAISEFGPGSVIYHEGSKYTVNRVDIDPAADSTLAMSSIKLCDNCGWLEKDITKDICEMCGTHLPEPKLNLFRMNNVKTKRRERITSDEEERMRYGYKICSTWRFEEHFGLPSHQAARLLDKNGKCLAQLKYGHGATLWRINLGWLNRPKNSPDGFMLDKSSGTWVRDSQSKGNLADASLLDPAAADTVERVIPYVEDRKNCLLLMPEAALEPAKMYSLQAALKQAILQLYQLEDFEISAEVMPTTGDPKNLLLVESAEGGAGILRHLVEDREAMARVARTALEICHFDADGKDLGHAPHSTEICVEACYDCLMNYANQRVHKELNRHIIKDILLAMASGSTETAEAAQDRGQHLEELKRLCDSELEKRWLDLLIKHNLRLPDEAQHRLKACKTVPDFWYKKQNTAIYIDGPHHEFPERRQRDEEQMECMEDMGITVIRFAAGEQWLAELQRHPQLFGFKKGAGA